MNEKSILNKYNFKLDDITNNKTSSNILVSGYV